MRKLSALTFAILLLSTSGQAAASCPPQSPSEQEAQADSILEGTVVKIVAGATSGEVTVKVDRVLKGTPGDVVVLETSLPGEFVAGEVPFNEGWKYWRLYLKEITPGSGIYYTSLCAGTAEIPGPASGSSSELRGNACRT